MLLLLQDIADKNCKSFLSDTLFCIIDNKKISIELKEGIFMAVTNNIREIREQRGIYQDDLAAAIGYSTKTVGRIDVGTVPHLPNLCCEYQSTLICWWKMYSMWKIESEQQSGSPSILDSFSCPYQQL